MPLLYGTRQDNSGIAVVSDGVHAISHGRIQMRLSLHGVPSVQLDNIASAVSPTT